MTPDAKYKKLVKISNPDAKRRTYIVFSEGELGYKKVKDLRGAGYEVERIVEDYLKTL